MARQAPEVQASDWKPECVKKWDEDTAAFKGLSLEEQTKQIALFEAKKHEEEKKE